MCELIRCNISTLLVHKCLSLYFVEKNIFSIFEYRETVIDDKHMSTKRSERATQPTEGFLVNNNFDITMCVQISVNVCMCRKERDNL